MGDRLATIDMGRKEGGGVLCPFRGRRSWAPSNTVCPSWHPFEGWVIVFRTTTYLYTKWQLDPSSRLATTDMGRKLGSCCASFLLEGVELGLHLRVLDRGVSPYQVTS